MQSFLKNVIVGLFLMCALNNVHAKEVNLSFLYSSEKEKWISDVTEQFNKGSFKSTDGSIIKVTATPTGSGDATIKKLLNGEIKAHLVSPASDLFIELANAESKEKNGTVLISAPRELVRSPVVIAMWKPMAEALGWGKQPIGWEEIFNMSDDPDGWKRYGHPEWGKFKFGHTHPKFSNSGLSALIAQVYAGAGKKKGLDLADINKDDVRKYVESIQKSVVHYGESTGFFGRKMFSSGPEFLSAAVLYENMVIESYDPQYQDAPFPIVAIYPKEGTFWANHPIGIVEREWVTPAHRDAAQVYIKYLLSRLAQDKAITYGFRPADTSVALKAPFDSEHGVDPTQPTALLETPSSYIINEMLNGLWVERKHRANVVLALDISGSMRGEKINNARKALVDFINSMDDSETLSVVTFNKDVNWLLQQKPLKENREEITKRISGLYASGDTSLYDAIIQGYQLLKKNASDGKISAMVVLSDGQDTSSSKHLDELLSTIRATESNAVLVFPIGYGSDADKEVLKKIANETKTRAYEGGVEDIQKILLDISTFF